MNRQVTAEKAWVIPYKVKEALGFFEIDVLDHSLLKTTRICLSPNHSTVFQ